MIGSWCRASVFLEAAVCQRASVTERSGADAWIWSEDSVLFFFGWRGDRFFLFYRVEETRRCEEAAKSADVMEEKAAFVPVWTIHVWDKKIGTSPTLRTNLSHTTAEYTGPNNTSHHTSCCTLSSNKYEKQLQYMCEYRLHGSSFNAASSLYFTAHFRQETKPFIVKGEKKANFRCLKLHLKVK